MGVFLFRLRMSMAWMTARHEVTRAIRKALGIKSLTDRTILIGRKMGILKNNEEIKIYEMAEVVRALIDSGDDRLYKGLLKQVKSKSCDYRGDAIRILGSPSLLQKTPKNIFYDRLEKDPNPWVRLAAFEALSKLDEESVKTRYYNGLCALIENPRIPPSEIGSICYIHYYINKDPHFRKKLCQYLINTKISERKRIEIARHLSLDLSVEKDKSVREGEEIIPYIKKSIKITKDRKNKRGLEKCILLLEGKL